MGFLSVIRRWALRDKMPIREIARRTGLSRNTIKKYLREDAGRAKVQDAIEAKQAGSLRGSFVGMAFGADAEVSQRAAQC